MTTNNGRSAGDDPPADPVLSEDVLVQQLRGLIAQERGQREKAERQVADSRNRERRYQRALTALEAQQIERESLARADRRTKAKHQDWAVSDKKVQQVYEAMVKLATQDPTRPLTITYIDRQTPGISAEAVRKAMEVLRAQERVRITGKKMPGGGVVWGLMPEATANA